MHGSIRAHDVGALLREYADRAPGRSPTIKLLHRFRMRPGGRYDGLPRTLFDYRERPDDYRRSSACMSPEKGVTRAIEIARRCGCRLEMAARISRRASPFFQKCSSYCSTASPTSARRYVGMTKRLAFGISCQAELGRATVIVVAVIGPKLRGWEPVTCRQTTLNVTLSNDPFEEVMKRFMTKLGVTGRVDQSGREDEPDCCPMSDWLGFAVQIDRSPVCDHDVPDQKQCKASPERSCRRG